MICSTFFFLGRFADKYRANGVEYRKLTKIYGLRFVLAITGEGGQFDIVNLFFATGMYCFVSKKISSTSLIELILIN